MNPGYRTRFQPVLLEAIRYRDADTDQEWRAARLALAVAVIRWAFGVEGPVVPVLPQAERCERWAALVDAAIEYATPEGATTLAGWSPERRNNCAAWHRLHHAAGRWARVAVYVRPEALQLVAEPASGGEGVAA